MSSARDEMLARIRSANTSGAPDVAVPERGYRVAEPGSTAHEALVELLVDRLVDYRASVIRCGPDEIAATLAGIVETTRIVSVAAPDGLDPAWTGDLAGVVIHHDTPLSSAALDAIDAVITTATVAIAETGTIVLDSSGGQGRRALTLVPDHHVVVLREEQIVRGVPEAIALLDPTRPQTWISGPSATSDIELIRIEGVHGPRNLHVVLVRN